MHPLCIWDGEGGIIVVQTNDSGSIWGKNPVRVFFFEGGGGFQDMCTECQLVSPYPVTYENRTFQIKAVGKTARQQYMSPQPPPPPPPPPFVRADRDSGMDWWFWFRQTTLKWCVVVHQWAPPPPPHWCMHPQIPFEGSQLIQINNEMKMDGHTVYE